MSAPGFDISAILRLLPHRYPFLLIDRILEVEPGERIRAIKNLTINEQVFQGHFPGTPIFPGVLILEALAQASGLLAFNTPGVCPDQEERPSLFMLVGIDRARFKKPVVPGDCLVLDVQVLRQRRNYTTFDAVASVEDEAVASAEIMCMFKDRPTSS